MVYKPPTSMAANKPKIIRNFLSGVNVCSISLLGILYYLTNYKFLFDLSIIIPQTYYIWDSFFIILHKKKNELGYVYHHFISMILLNHATSNSLTSGHVYAALIVGELSNLSIITVYHLTKTLNLEDIEDKKRLHYWKKIQLCWYGFFRIPVLGVIFFKALETLSYFYYIPYISIYVMGVIWSKKQFDKYLIDKKELLKEE